MSNEYAHKPSLECRGDRPKPETRKPKNKGKKSNKKTPKAPEPTSTIPKGPGPKA